MISEQSDGTAPATMSAQLAALGPFFAVEFHDPRKRDQAWRPMSELLDDPSVLDARVAAVRGFLAGGTSQNPHSFELRVAASIVHLGLVARVIAPLFATTLVDGRVPAVSLRDLRWQPTLGSTFPLSMPYPESDTPRSTRPTGPTTILDGAVAELLPLAARFGVSVHILRGNVASALGGAVNALSAVRPDLAPAARLQLNRLIDQPMLAGSAHLEPEGGLRRHSCCLIYRATPGKDGALCGDCALAPGHIERRR